jgi:hypothetical protein
MRYFNNGGTTSDPAGQIAGTEESLSTWAAPYVTDMLAKGKALADQPYTAYTGPLTAGQSGLQTQAFQGIAGLTVPTAQMGAYNPTSFTSGTTAQQYMNPYLQASLEPQIAEAQRQAQIQQVANASRLNRAGAYGGSRQAIMDSESQRNLLRNLADITSTGYSSAYDKAQTQFNTEEDRRRAAQQDTNVYGLRALDQMRTFGDAERAIEAEGIAADIAQFESERDDPYKKLQYQQSLLQGLPVQAQTRDYVEQSGLSEILSQIGAVGEAGAGWAQLMEKWPCKDENETRNAFGFCVSK